MNESDRLPKALKPPTHNCFPLENLPYSTDDVNFDDWYERAGYISEITRPSPNSLMLIMRLPSDKVANILAKAPVKYLEVDGDAEDGENQDEEDGEDGEHIDDEDEDYVDSEQEYLFDSEDEKPARKKAKTVHPH